MFQKWLTEFAISKPKTVIWSSIIVTLLFLMALPFLKTDTDPVHMLPANNHAVTLYNQIKSEFNLSDMVALGIQGKNGQSIFTAKDLTQIDLLTKEILKLRDKDGTQIFIPEDIISVSTVDDISKNVSGELQVTPLMPKAPQNDLMAQDILKKLNANPMLGGKMNSLDGNTIGIFIPLKNGMKERSYYLGEQIKQLAEKYLPNTVDYYFAGLPIAESTFGNEMFIQMAVYAPAAGIVIFLLMLFFFRSLPIVIAPMLLGGMVVIWSMGALIYSGNVIHIMSSMIPIFLLPIAVLNSIHILSKLADVMGHYQDKKDAIRHVMKELFSSMLYASFTTIVGFVSLSTTGIPPVIVFGVTVGFGVFLSWLLSMIFIPAYTMLISDKTISDFAKISVKSKVIDVVHSFRNIAWSAPKTVIAAATIVLIISAIGLTKIVVNDNPVRWFKAGHNLRLADEAMNKKLAGTYMANLYFSFPKPKTEKVVDDFSDEPESAFYPSIKEPAVIAYIDQLGSYLKTLQDQNNHAIVGDVTSIADVLKKIGTVAFNSNDLPQTKEQISQYLFLFESGDLKRGKDLWKIITPNDSLSSQMWVYLKSGDNQNMTTIMNKLSHYMKTNPPPVFEVDGKKVQLEVNWSGLMNINNVWQNLMVSGMLNSLLGSFITVFIMMIILFRSITWSAIAMLPLTITIAFIYGVIGFSGKFYDMPIAVLSSLTLGLSIDFAIHFIEHARAINKKHNNLKRTFADMFDGTAQAIWKNVLVISIGFLPLFFAGLVPYITVGSFFFAIMIVSGGTTLVLMPSLLKVLYKYLPDFKESTIEDHNTQGVTYEKESISTNV